MKDYATSKCVVLQEMREWDSMTPCHYINFNCPVVTVDSL